MTTNTSGANNTNAIENLKKIEEMLSDIGAAPPAALTGQNGHMHVSNSSPKKVKGGSPKAKKDCLAQQQHNKPTVSGSYSRRDASSMSLQRGAPMAGKDCPEKRFYGTNFQLPPRDSPGPIYEPPILADALSQTFTFSRAPRSFCETPGSPSPGPKYSVPTCLGKQVMSAASNSPQIAFTRSRRFNAREFISRAHSKNGSSLDAPAPTAYQPDILALTEKSQGVSFSGSRSVPMNKVFISRAHVVDCIGAASPGPIYGLDDSAPSKGRNGFTSAVSTHYSAPSFTFGTSSRRAPTTNEEKVAMPPITDSQDTCKVVRGEGGKGVRVCVHSNAQPGGVCEHIPQEMFISRLHSKIQNTTETPGPSFYAPDANPVLSAGPAVSFARDRGSKKRFFSKSLSLSKGADSPGPKYMLKETWTQKNIKTAIVGGPRDDKVFLGRGMGEAPGRFQSPGPMYDPALPNDAPSFTIVGKERQFPRSIFPGPSRSRFVSKELSRENRGAYSPGPKYDVRSKSIDGPKYTFGVSDRYFGDQFTAEQKKKFGTAEKPYTCPGEARFISVIHNRSASAGKTSPGPANPRVTPKDDFFCSNNQRMPTVKIAKPVGKPRRPASEEPQDDGEKKSPRLLYPNDTLTQPDHHAHKFSEQERLPSSKAAATPGPGQYAVRHTLVERKITNEISFGGV